MRGARALQSDSPMIPVRLIRDLPRRQHCNFASGVRFTSKTSRRATTLMAIKLSVIMTLPHHSLPRWHHAGRAGNRHLIARRRNCTQ